MTERGNLLLRTYVTAVLTHSLNVAVLGASGSLGLYLIIVSVIGITGSLKLTATDTNSHSEGLYRASACLNVNPLAIVMYAVWFSEVGFIIITASASIYGITLVYTIGINLIFKSIIVSLNGKNLIFRNDSITKSTVLIFGVSFLHTGGGSVGRKLNTVTAYDIESHNLINRAANNLNVYFNRLALGNISGENSVT